VTALEGIVDAILRKAYRTVEQKLRELAEGPLDELVARCAETEAAYPQAAPFGDDPPLRRFLGRVGLLPKRSSPANLYELVGKVANATGERQAVVKRVLDLYCAPADGIRRVMCDEVPRCEECPLAPECKFRQRKPSIKELPADQRPRERLIAEGEQALADAELLAILLRSGTEEDTAITLASKLLAKFGSLRALAGRTIGELSSFKGIGPAKAAQIKAAVEIGRRIAQQAATEPGKRLGNSQTVYDMYAPRLRDLRKETFLVLLLDAKNRVSREVEVSVGSLTASVAHPREVFNEAVRDSAAAILCVHNHPTGDPTPSQRDTEITRKLHATGQVLGIHLLDHIIIGETTYYSFADDGKLPEERRDDG
jgi:DNA repair protein RadC